MRAIGCSKKEDEGNLVYTKEDGTQTKDITSIEDGTTKFEMLDDIQIPEKVKLLHDLAREKGQAGAYNEAVGLLEQAIAVAPNWAYPYYDLAFTYLLMGEREKAFLNYKKVDELEPLGFFTAKTAIWCLERESDGSFPEGLYASFVMLEWQDKEAQKSISEQLTDKFPNFAPAWKLKASFTESFQDKIECLHKGLTAKPDAETHGMLLINKVIGWL